MKTVLTIAGSDCSGGAGIQADIKTITAYKMYAMSAITALTAQNTTGVYGVLDAGAEFVSLQLKCIFEDIFPDAVKIGMVSSREIICAIAESLEYYNARNIVVDPVMVSTSGSRLLGEGAADALATRLMPLAALVTPNIPEAEAISGITIRSAADMALAAHKISSGANCGVLVKGGHLAGSADDLLYANSKDIWFRSERIDNLNTHGTGCTLSSAIACNLALGLSLEESARNAKNFICGALGAGLDLGRGSGPLDHCFNIQSFLQQE